MIRKTGLALACCTLLAATQAPPEAPEIIVYAAASTRDALAEMAPGCERAAGVRLVFNFGASNELARQIEAANKADIFLSADESWMDRVAAAGLIDAESRRALLSNRLVVVAAPGLSQTIGSAADLARAPARWISLANPEAVPAGKYAKAWLESQGQWEAIRPRVLPAVDVRAALAAVEAGGGELGIVYATDAALSRKARIVHVVPDDEAPRIVYPIAALRDRPHLDRARAVVAWMAGPEAAAVFQKFGFIVTARR